MSRGNVTHGKKYFHESCQLATRENGMVPHVDMCV